MKKLVLTLVVVALMNVSAFAADTIKDNGKLTYPTASNIQDIVIFAFTKSGAYRYNPEEHSITLVADGDHRALTGTPRLVSPTSITSRSCSA